MSDYQVVLLGNYAPACQQSMLRFAEMLRDGWHRRGRPATLVQPEPHWGPRFPARWRKWGAYVDQYLRFPARAASLAAASGWAPARPTVFHVCDHSNSPYLRGLVGRHAVLTCHDLLAVRGARGEPTYCPASPTGKILQSLILSYLTRFPFVACDSAATRADFLRLTGRVDADRVTTIPLALNAPFAPVPLAEARARLAKMPDLLDAPFVLHVGSGLARKNRAGVLRTLAQVRAVWPGRVVFAGEPLHAAEQSVARELGLPADAVREFPDPTHAELEALYSCALALVYPSYAEGYGWPVLEAQACGCPVISSNTTSLPEVADPGSWLGAPDDTAGFAAALLALAGNADARADRARAGRDFAAHFTTDRMLDAYAGLYERALAAPPV